MPGPDRTGDGSAVRSGDTASAGRGEENGVSLAGLQTMGDEGMLHLAMNRGVDEQIKEALNGLKDVICPSITPISLSHLNPNGFFPNKTDPRHF